MSAIQIEKTPRSLSRLGQPRAKLLRRLLPAFAAATFAVSVATSMVLRWSRAVEIDEAGYSAVARLWANGEKLYQGAWIDRPPLILLIFRALNSVAPHSRYAMHAMSAFAIAATLLLVCAISNLLDSRRSAMLAAVFLAIFYVSKLDFVSANGEMLASPFICGAIYLALKAIRAVSARHVAMFAFVSGALAACAPLIKQSAFDGGVVAFAIIAIAQTTTRRKALGGFTVGAISVCALTFLHATTIGLSLWWNAVAGARFQANSSLHHNGIWTRLKPGFLMNLIPLLPCFVGCGLAVLPMLLRRGRTRNHEQVDRHESPTFSRTTKNRMFFAWIMSSAVGFFLGGEFWQHYWLLPAIPMSMVAGMACNGQLSVDGRTGRSFGVILIVLTTISAFFSIMKTSQLSYATHEAAIAFVDRELPKETPVLVLGDATQFFFGTNRPTVSRYLWQGWIKMAPNELERLCALVNSTAPPALVLTQAKFSEPDPLYGVRSAMANRLLAAIESNYISVKINSTYTAHRLGPERVASRC